MTNSISSSSPVNHSYTTQQASHPPKAKKPEPQDTVVLSKQAQAAADPDHDGH